MRVTLHFPGQETTFKLKPNRAIALVSEGLAQVIGDHAIRLNPPKIVSIIAASSILAKCGQGDTYEKAAIETVLRYCTGGLTRTETQPAPFSKCKGARVGHQ